jgi:AcrR family transcriptional regulator
VAPVTAERVNGQRRDPPRPETLVAYQRARRERIVAAAEELMLEREHDTIQMKEVGARAGVALGTVYRYFRSKDHLFAEALLSWSDRYGRQVAAPEGASLDRLKVAYRRAVRAFERHPFVYSTLLAVQATNDPLAVEVYEEFAARQGEAFASYLPRVPSPRREEIVMVMSAVLDAGLRDVARGRRQIRTVYEQLDTAADLLLR